MHRFFIYSPVHQLHKVSGNFLYSRRRLKVRGSCRKRRSRGYLLLTKMCYNVALGVCLLLGRKMCYYKLAQCRVIFCGQHDFLIAINDATAKICKTFWVYVCFTKEMINVCELLTYNKIITSEKVKFI